MEDKHPNMIPIPVRDLIGGSTSPVNLYVRIGADKFVLISKAGTKTDKERLQSYENKTVEYLWVKREEYGFLMDSNITIAGVLVNQKSLTTAQKTLILSQAAAGVFTELEHIGLGFETYSHARQIVEATVALAESNNNLNTLLSSLNDCSDELLRHSMAVTSISVLIANALNWENKQTVEKLALGALLHDIGLKALPPELVNKPRALMSFEENQQYETHPYKGMQMLLNLGVVPDDVVAIVYEHHENAIGQGYPRKLRNIKMHPLAKVVALANDFCELTVPGINNPTARSPREALVTIEMTMGQPHNKEAFRALQQVVNREYAKSA